MITGALQVAGGGQPLLLARRGQQQRRALQPPQAVASDAAAATAREEGGKVALGGSGVAVTKLGVGAWSWGDTTYWNEFQWDDRKLKAAKGAFDASIDCGITFFDTAEVYGAGVRTQRSFMPYHRSSASLQVKGGPGASGRVLPSVTGRFRVRVTVSSYCTDEDLSRKGNRRNRRGYRDKVCSSSMEVWLWERHLCAEGLVGSPWRLFS